MADEPHTIYKYDMDTDLPKETLDSCDIVIRKKIVQQLLMN